MGLYKCELCRVHVCPLECVCVCARVWQRSVHLPCLKSFLHRLSDVVSLSCSSAHRSSPLPHGALQNTHRSFPSPHTQVCPPCPRNTESHQGQGFCPWCREGFKGSCEVFKVDFSKTKPWGAGAEGLGTLEKLGPTFSLPCLLSLQEW